MKSGVLSVGIYDPGRITEITYPDTKTIEFAYNNQGKVKRRTDQRDIVTYYRYDKLRAMTLRTTDPAAAGDPVADDPNYVPDPDRVAETFTYDGLDLKRDLVPLLVDFFALLLKTGDSYHFFRPNILWKVPAGRQVPACTQLSHLQATRRQASYGIAGSSRYCL